MNRQRAAHLLLQTLKYAVIAACFLYIGKLIWSNLDNLKAHEFRLRPLPLIASFPLGVAYLFARGLVWHLIVRRMIGRYPLRLDLLSWMSSLAGKYLPGKVFLLFGRIYLYRGQGASASQVSVAFLMEACCSALATLAVFGIAAVQQQTGSLAALGPAMAVVAAGLIVVTHPAVLRLGINTARRMAKRPAIEFQLRWRDVLYWTLLIVLAWLVLGAGFFLLLWSFIDLPVSLYLYVTGAFAVAGVIGVLALFAPSGIGVREGVMTFVLAQVISEGLAATAAILSRIWITAAEALCAAVALLMVRNTARDADPSEEARAQPGPGSVDRLGPPP